MELRYDMMFSSRGTQRIGGTIEYKRYQRYKRAKEQGAQGVLKDATHTIRSIKDIKAVTSARRAALRLGGRLIIKKYPMGQCSPNEIERYLNYLEAHENFIPDVLILDYIDILDLSMYGTELRHKLNSGYIWAKGLADERNILVATVSQVASSALKKLWVTEKDVAEDRRKAGNCDIMLAIGRGDSEVASNKAGISVIANRSGLQGVSCAVSLSYEIGQFCLSSWLASDVKDQTETLNSPD